jgi:GH25 family lysozyme M1 (1,4-beta-N-acetylmuramidase)
MIPDISEYQGGVDWNALGAAYRAGQIEGIIIRAGFGTVRADHQLAVNQAGARAQGIPHLYYWFCYPGINSPEAEAAKFNAVVGQLQPGEGQVGDFENDPSLPRASQWPADGLAWARGFLTACGAPQSATGWYTSLGFARAHNLLPLGLSWWAWQAEYGPAQPTPGMNPVMWQYADNVPVPGINGPCDASKMIRGRFTDLVIPAAPDPPTPPSPDQKRGVQMFTSNYGGFDHVFWVDANGQLQQRWQPPGGFTGGHPWGNQSIGAIGIFEPGTLVNGWQANNQQHIFALAADKLRVGHAFQSLNGTPDWAWAVEFE